MPRESFSRKRLMPSVGRIGRYRLDAKTENISDSQTACLERSGDISFIKKKK